MRVAATLATALWLCCSTAPAARANPGWDGVYTMTSK